MRTQQMDTRHFQQRTGQRGITRDLVDLTLEYGERNRDKHVLNRRNLERLLSDIKTLERTVKRALDKGGVVVVEEGGHLITTYNLDSFSRRARTT